MPAVGTIYKHPTLFRTCNEIKKSKLRWNLVHTSVILLNDSGPCVDPKVRKITNGKSYLLSKASGGSSKLSI